MPFTTLPYDLFLVKEAYPKAFEYLMSKKPVAIWLIRGRITIVLENANKSNFKLTYEFADLLQFEKALIHNS